MLITILAIVGLVLAAILIYAATKPDSFGVQRATAINAPAEKIFPLINDLHAHTSWSPFEKDPNMKRTHSGAPQGKGAVYEWDGDRKVGSGRLAIADSTPSNITMILDMFKPIQSPQHRQLPVGAAGQCDAGHLGHARPAALHGQAHEHLHQLRQDGRRPVRGRGSPN